MKPRLSTRLTLLANIKHYHYILYLLYLKTFSADRLPTDVLMYVGVVVLLRNLPLYGGRFDSPLIRDLESRRDVLTGQSAGDVG